LLRLVGLSMDFAFDGAVGVKELVGDIGKDGGAAWGYAAFGNEDQKAVEEFVDVHGGIELREFGKEIGGEVFRVALGVQREGAGGAYLRVAVAEARVNWQAGKAAALAVGIAIGAARSIGFHRDGDGIGDGAWANGRGVHELFLVWVGRGVHPPSDA
jgi:hypothetical protein